MPQCLSLHGGRTLKLTEQSILTELKASGNLPSPTGVALTILDLTRDPDTSTEDMAMVLHGDPALTGQILKYANSALAGSREEISSINDALVRLGMGLVRQLCLGFSVLSNARGGPCPAFDYNRYWRRSLALAVACQAVAPRLSNINPDEAFTCGLLSHIGTLALASVYPQEYAEVLGNGTGKTCRTYAASSKRLSPRTTSRSPRSCSPTGACPSSTGRP